MEDPFQQNFAAGRPKGGRGFKKIRKSVYNPNFPGKNKACTLEEREEVCFMQNNNNRENNQNQNERSQNKQQNEQRNQKENRK